VLLSGSTVTQATFGSSQPNTEAGLHHYTVLASVLHGSTTVFLSAGVDEFDALAKYTKFKGDLKVSNTAGGIATLDIDANSASVSNRVQITGDLTYTGSESGRNNLRLQQVNIGDVFSATSGGAGDVVNFSYVSVVAQLAIACGNSADQVSLDHTSAHSTTLDGGAGIDRLILGPGNNLGQKTIKNFESVQQT
jgi:hypothetical protein